MYTFYSIYFLYAYTFYSMSALEGQTVLHNICEPTPKIVTQKIVADSSFTCSFFELMILCFIKSFHLKKYEKMTCLVNISKYFYIFIKFLYIFIYFTFCSLK